MPFLVMFCHVIETSEASDLEHMRGFVETLESVSNPRTHSTCLKQRALFKAVYDIAAKYVEAGSRTGGLGQVGTPWSIASPQCMDALAGTAPNSLGSGAIDSVGTVGHPGSVSIAGSSPGHMPSHGGPNVGFFSGLQDGLVEPAALQNAAASGPSGNVDMEVGLSGAQLWYWFHQTQSIMRILEDA